MVPTSDLSHNAKRQSYQDIGSNVLEADGPSEQRRENSTSYDDILRSRIHLAAMK